MNIKNFKSFQSRLYNLITLLRETKKTGPRPDSQKVKIGSRLTTLPTDISFNLILRESRVQPRIRWNMEHFKYELFWTSLDLSGFLALMATLDILGPGNFLSCPRCQKLFLTSSKRTKYCSPSCYDNFKVQKYQKKKKAEALAKQKRKSKRTIKGKTKK